MKYLLLVVVLFVLWGSPIAGAADEVFDTTVCADTCLYQQMEIMVDEPERSSIYLDNQGSTNVDAIAFIQDLYTLPASQLEISYENDDTWYGIYGIEGELTQYAYFRFGVRNNYLPGPLYYYWGDELLYKPNGLFLYVDTIVVLFMQEETSGRVYAFALKTAQMTSPFPDGSFNGQHLFGAYEVDPDYVDQLFLSYLQPI